MVPALLFAPSKFILLVKNISSYNLVQLYVVIKHNYTVVTHLCGSWLNIFEFRRDVYHILQMWIVCRLLLLLLLLLNRYPRPDDVRILVWWYSIPCKRGQRETRLWSCLVSFATLYSIPL